MWGRGCGSHLHGFGAVAGFACDLHIGVRGEQLAQADAGGRFIIDNQHAYQRLFPLATLEKDVGLVLHEAGDDTERVEEEAGIDLRAQGLEFGAAGQQAEFCSRSSWSRRSARKRTFSRTMPSVPASKRRRRRSSLRKGTPLGRESSSMKP